MPLLSQQRKKMSPDVTKPDTAMVFAAGLGTRMRPITNNLPKCLVKVNGKALLDYVLDSLADSGVSKAVVNTHYLAEMVEEHLKSRKSPQILISHETPHILETGGGIVKARPLLGNKAFYTVNTDTLVIDDKIPALKKLAAEWDPVKMDALLLLVRMDKAVGYDGNGDFNLLPNGLLQRQSGGGGEFIYSGLMIIKPELFQGLEEKPFSIFRDYIFKDKKYNNEDGSMPRFYGLVHEGKWLHVGTPEAIGLAEDALRS